MIKNCPSILFHVIFAVVVIALSAVLSSQVKGDEADHRRYCLAAEYLAAGVMLDRIQGTPFTAVLGEIDDKFHGPALPLMTRVAAQAYNSPLADFTGGTSVEISLEFAAYVRLDCYHSW